MSDRGEQQIVQLVTPDVPPKNRKGGLVGHGPSLNFKIQVTIFTPILKNIVKLKFILFE